MADNRVPTVARVCSDTLIELVYDAKAHRTALAVSRFDGLWNIEQEVRIETGEILAPYSASNNLITSGCVLLPAVPTDFGSKEELIADIAAYLHRYVDLSPLFEKIAAYYVLLSWVHDAFGELPYLRLRGDYGTGKTRALMAIGSVSYRPFFASGASTVSPIFHTLDSFGGTLVLDEADMPFSDAKAELVKILNNGTVKGMPVLRTIQNRHKEFNPYAFKVFGPKLVATRERFQDRALESRFLTEETGARPLRSDIPVHMPRHAKDEALQLRNRLLHFRFCNFYHIQTDLSALIEGVEPRLNQMALALLSLVEDGELRAQIQAHLIADHHDVLRARRDAPEARVLSSVLAAFNAHEGATVSIGTIAEEFNKAFGSEMRLPIEPRWIGKIVRERLHLATKKSNGVYVVPRSELPKLDALIHRLGL
ncbi:MAG: hypothetical protein ACTHPD_17555 [Rhizomicrobium sp.]